MRVWKEYLWNLVETLRSAAERSGQPRRRLLENDDDASIAATYEEVMALRTMSLN